MATAVASYFRTDRVRLSFASGATGTRRSFGTVREIVREVREARIASGRHLRRSMLDGERPGTSGVAVPCLRLQRPGMKMAAG